MNEGKKNNKNGKMMKIKFEKKMQEASLQEDRGCGEEEGPNPGCGEEEGPNQGCGE